MPSLASLPDSIVLIHDSTNLGGAELHLLKILKVLRELGISTHLITCEQGSLFEQFVQHTDSQCIASIPYPRKPKTWRRIPKFTKTCKRFINEIGAQSPCILVGDLYPLWAALKLKQCAPVVALWQGEYDFNSNECIEKWIRYGANKADMLLANGAICQHAESTSLLKRPLETLNPEIDRTRFDPNGYDKTELRKSFGWTQPTAVCVGRYGDGKGQPWLVEQFLKNKELYKNWRLILVGPISKDDRDALNERLKKEDTDKHIELWGERLDIPEIYAAADLALFPGTVQESYGLSVLEAVTMRTPIIATASGALPFLLGEDFGLISCNQRAKLIQAWEEDSPGKTTQKAIPALSSNMKEELLGILGKQSS